MAGTTQDAGATQDLAAEWTRTMTRAMRALEMATAPEPAIGLTPKELVYRRNKARLYRYASARTHRTPVLFVPNLGISRPSIFDLQPGSSFVEHMCRQGYDFYLLDWGVYGEEDNLLTVDECVTRLLPRVVKKVLETSGADGLAVIGYCMGAPLSVSFVAQHPEVPQCRSSSTAATAGTASSGWCPATRILRSVPTAAVRRARSRPVRASPAAPPRRPPDRPGLLPGAVTCPSRGAASPPAVPRR